MGVIEYQEGTLRQKTKATQLGRTEPAIGFLCAMLRGRDRAVMESAGKVTAQREEQIKQKRLVECEKLRTRIN